VWRGCIPDSSRLAPGSTIGAFPQLLHEVRPLGEYLSPEKVLRSCYSLRCLENFAEFMGLAEIERDPVDRYAEVFQIRKLPLLEHTVVFHTD